MPHLLDPPFPTIVSDTTSPSATRFPRGTVILCVSPLASIRDTTAALVASLAAGNRTVVTFPVGAPGHIVTRLRALSRLVGRRLRVAGAAGLAALPDPHLAHLVSVTATETSLDGSARVPHGERDSPVRRVALAALLTTDFSVSEWDDRVGVTAPIAPACASGTFDSVSAAIRA